MSKEEREACVDAFAAGMKRKLAENAHKGDRDGWRNDSAEALVRRLREEVDEIEVALVATPASRRARLVADEGFDVGNFAMMIADVAGGLDVHAPSLADQPPPTIDASKPAAWDTVRARLATIANARSWDASRLDAAMLERDRLGESRYGTRLRSFNGRDAGVDALQEALDLCAYLAQRYDEAGPDDTVAALELLDAAILLAGDLHFVVAVQR